MEGSVSVLLPLFSSDFFASTFTWRPVMALLTLLRAIPRLPIAKLLSSGVRITNSELNSQLNGFRDTLQVGTFELPVSRTGVIRVRSSTDVTDQSRALEQLRKEVLSRCILLTKRVARKFAPSLRQEFRFATPKSARRTETSLSRVFIAESRE